MTTLNHMLQRSNRRGYDAGDGVNLDIRTVPDLDGDRNGATLMPGDIFEVSEKHGGVNGVTYLRLADGRGWAFDYKPGVGLMCEPYRAKVSRSVAFFGGA